MVSKAVDVVLLPDEAMTARAIELNRSLVGEYASEIVLDKQRCLPHVSLAMGCIDERDIEPIEGALRAIAQRCPVAGLRVAGKVTARNSRGQEVAALAVAKTPELQTLHENVRHELAPWLSYEASDRMIYGDGPVAETTLQWIKAYPTRSSFERFAPHITIGYGGLAEPVGVIDFATSKLALCHLGNHCTCRAVLVAIEL